MDIICPKCGEPWDHDSLHEEVAERELEGETATYHGVLREFQASGCGVAFRAFGGTMGEPCTAAERPYSAHAAEALYDLLGDDIDGAAAMLEDFGLS